MGGGTSTQSTAKQELKTARSNAIDRIGSLGVASRYHAQNERLLEDDYDVTSKELGSGLNGAVLLATSKSTGESVAIKPFKLWGITKVQKNQLRNEVEMVLSMDHPHIARIADVYESQTELTLVMECLEGGELFDRISEKSMFTEGDAADATRQMLLAISYLHTKSIVHRDIKCENFLYDKKGGTFLKLIDFGFSRVHKGGKHMKLGCGTIAYMAPEVLGKDYTDKCDLWSMGVIVFILLMGYMPFGSGISEQEMAKRIQVGNYTKEASWSRLSAGAVNFVESLLVVNPDKRISAPDALAHEWLTTKRDTQDSQLDSDVVASLCQFANSSKFKRICLSAMAFSVSNEERAQVREAFLQIDTDNSGTITLNELKDVLLLKMQVSDSKVEEMFATFEHCNAGAEEVNYSDFLAAMMAYRIEMHNDLLIATFRRFDTDSTGFITANDLKHLLGEGYSGDEVDRLIAEADISGDGRIGEQEFIDFLSRGDVTDGEKAIVDAVEHLVVEPVVTGQALRASEQCMPDPPAALVAPPPPPEAQPAAAGSTSTLSGAATTLSHIKDPTVSTGTAAMDPDVIAAQRESRRTPTEQAPANTAKQSKACVIL